MASKIKGITIEIGGDTTGLDKALSGVNKQIKTTQSNLKEVNSALRLDPGNTELLEQKQRALAEAVSATAEKLDTLKDAQAQAAEQLARGDIGQEQYDALTREIVKTEAALKQAKQAADGFSVGMEQAKVAVDKVGSAASTVATKTKKLSAAAAGVVTAFGAAAYKSAQMADDLNTLSAQTGISTEDLQKMSYAADRVDVSVETITGSMSKMKKSMVSDSADTVAAFERIGVSVTNADGSLRNATDVFYEALEGLSQVGNETERDTLAMQIFGRGADEMAGIIDDGGAALKALGDEAMQLGVVLDQETLDSLNAVNDQIDQLKAKATGEIATAGAKAMEALAPVLDAVIEKLSALLDWIGSLDEQQIQTILTVAAVIAAISPIAGIIATISAAVSQFLAIWPQVKAVALGIKAFAAANPLILVMTVIAALAALIYTHWDKIKPILQALWEKVKEVFDNIKDKITAAMDAVKEVFETVKETFVGIWEAILNTAKDKINGIIGLINGLIGKINSFIDSVENSGISGAVLGAFGLKLGRIPTIPLLAKGGSLLEGPAIVGEAGPELLTMNNGRANVQPLTTTTNTYNTYNQASRQPLQVNLVLDGMTIARKLVDPLRTAEAERGPVFVR